MAAGIERFSPRQLEVLTWWQDGSPHRGRDAIICDGAVRSGKTLAMGLSFFLWAMRRFRGEQFALCGKTGGALRRNLLAPLLPLLRQLGMRCCEQYARGRLVVRFGAAQNVFYLFGGRDESSAALIQGVTLAGALLDEAALMPRSFVEQACARCSVEGARLWFNCNPEGPRHWFYTEWIRRAEERNALYLHFTMEDNPALSARTREKYRGLYAGVFHRRFILGEWAAAEGRVYDFFHAQTHAKKPPAEPLERYCISCDYGTLNPASFGLWGRRDGVWFRVAEFYHDARRAGFQKTDREYADDLRRLAGGRRIETVVVDPSAASFIETLRRDGWNVRRAKNDVLSGIRVTADLLRRGEIVICDTCPDALREFDLYVWEDGRDAPKKEHDHAMDDIRYFAATIAAGRGEPFAARFVERGRL